MGRRLHDTGRVERSPVKDMISDLLNRISSGRDLTGNQARLAFEHVMAGDLSDAAIAELLGALAAKGECVDELRSQRCY